MKCTFVATCPGTHVCLHEARVVKSFYWHVSSVGAGIIFAINALVNRGFCLDVHSAPRQSLSRCPYKNLVIL